VKKAFVITLCGIIGSAVFALATTANASAGSQYVWINSGTARAGYVGIVHPRRPRVRAAALRVLVGPPRLPASAIRGAITTATCPGNPPGAVCGTVDVPLDRSHPKAATIAIFFELFTHSNPGPAQSAILVNWGGPGVATTDPGDAANALQLFGSNLDSHDLLLIDDRGRGYSGTINCVALQHGTEPFAKAAADCASQLGAADSFYGTGDVALDTETVRKTLGYDKVDYYGASAGGGDVTAYATRFGSHLRSIVLDAPVGAPGLVNNFVNRRQDTHSEPRMIALVCAYSPTCRHDHPNPFGELDWLIRHIRANPIEGLAFDANGNLVRANVDETNLLAYLVHNPTGQFVSTGELLAAAESLHKGDPAPLLRLEAEAYSPIGGDFGDPTVFSMGAEAATGCSDSVFPWQWSVPTGQRLEQYAENVAMLPRDYFEPFSIPAATGFAYNNALYCVWWQHPTPPAPVVLPGAVYPRVPTLVLSGDMDDVVPLEEVGPDAALFPESALVTVAEAGHITVGWSTCAANLVAQFVETRHVGSTSCVRTPQVVFPAVGRFSLFAKDASPAVIDPTGHNQLRLYDRKVVTVAVAAAVDALQRSTIGSGSDHCLRAGWFTTVYGATSQTSTLNNCYFTSDVGVTGLVRWRSDNSFEADLAVHGEGTVGGILHVAGTWRAPGPVGYFKVTGTIGGLNVALLVPEA